MAPGMDAVLAAVHEKISPFDRPSGFSFATEAAEFSCRSVSIFRRGHFDNRLLRFPLNQAL